MPLPYDRDLRVEHVNNGLSFAIWWPDETAGKAPASGRRWWFRAAFTELEPLLSRSDEPLVWAMIKECAHRVRASRSGEAYPYDDRGEHGTPEQMVAEVPPDMIRQIFPSPKESRGLIVPPELWALFAAVRFRMAIQTPDGRMPYVRGRGANPDCVFNGTVFHLCGSVGDPTHIDPRPLRIVFAGAAPMLLLYYSVGIMNAKEIEDDDALADLRAEIIAEMKTLRDAAMAEKEDNA